MINPRLPESGIFGQYTVVGDQVVVKAVLS
jgi:hypothetical protein